MMSDINLDDPRIMSASEAAKRWGLNDSRLRQKIEDFPEGTARKFGKQWVVTEDGMIQVFGPNMIEEETDLSKLQTAYKFVNDMADKKGLSVQQFPHITNHAILVGDVILVWLDNMHWKELRLSGGDYKSRDYGGKDSLEDKMQDLYIELRQRQEKLEQGYLVIDKFSITKEAIEHMIQKSIKKKAN